MVVCNVVVCYDGFDFGVCVGCWLCVLSYGMYGYVMLCLELFVYVFDFVVKYYWFVNGMFLICWVE